jgi:hypothetical protein
MRYISVISGVAAALAFAATASAGSFEDKAQVTVSGAKYKLNDHMVKTERDSYWIGKTSGDMVRVADTEGTQASDPIAAGNVNVAIEISEKAFHITKGGTERGFTLIAGMPTVIQLRNRDLVAHEFVSTLFRDVPFRMSGNATLVKTARASGVRLDPGQIVTLEFNAPLANADQYGAAASSYDVFWCNVHGKEHGQKMRGELLIIETRGEIGGG